MPAVIQIDDLVKRFANLTAVDHVSLTVGKGQFFGLLGPNGAGKTSIIRMLYGFIPPTAGRLRLFGDDLQANWRVLKSRIGVCQQDNTLDPDLSVAQNLTVYASYFALPASAAQRRANELLNFFALETKRDAKVMELSGGMVRRLMLARALINQPDLLILDEPTTGLDPQSRHQLWDKLEILKSEGLTVLVTTHYMEEAARLCDELVIIDHGRILVQGAPEPLIHQHAGHQVIELIDPGAKLMDFISKHEIVHDRLKDRVILYLSEDGALYDIIRQDFCRNKCRFRPGTLEDVFLRLTGRELRE
jgi:lipooligosaccharide transport system ATP-binding protein